MNKVVIPPQRREARLWVPRDERGDDAGMAALAPQKKSAPPPARRLAHLILAGV
jgi:hypothetical protein